MPISLKPKHLQRYKNIAALALKYRHVDADPATASPPIAPGVTPSGYIDGVGLAEELFRAYLKPPGAARPRAA